MEWYQAVLQKYTVFSGRARRKEYWMFVLVNFVIVVGLEIVMGIIGSMNDNLMYLGSGLISLYGLFVFLPALAVAVRRLHDVGKSGWWYFIALVPFIGAIWLLILFASDSQPGENQYGPNPKELVSL
jgi:uncharacterized membrane protein YhaH (DUF805 family)